MATERYRGYSGSEQPTPSSRREIILGRSDELVEDYARKIISMLRPPVRRGDGKEVFGDVEGRQDDEELVIDVYGERLLHHVIGAKDIPSRVLGEHSSYAVVTGRTQMFWAIDSFDNTSQYKRGLDTPVYSCLGGFSAGDLEPRASVVCNIKDNQYYIATSSGRLGLIDLENYQETPIERSKRASIKDKSFTLATYLGSNEYSLGFLRYFERMLQDMDPKGLLYGGGGSYIYALLASGAVDAYVMFKEPRGEIDPGLPLAIAAGCTVVSVDPETGRYEPYRFAPNQYRGSVPFFIAAASPKVRDEIIQYYMESKERMPVMKHSQEIAEILRNFINSIKGAKRDLAIEHIKKIMEEFV